VNGLEFIPPKTPALLERLLRRRPARSLPVEINNYVATTQLSEVARERVERIISDCGSADGEAKETCAQVYARVVGHLAQDGKITDEELEHLRRLRGALGLSAEDAREAESASLLPLYRERLRESLADRHFMPAEGESLEDLARELRLDDSQTDRLVLDETFKSFEKATRRTVFSSVEDALEEAHRREEADGAEDL
jgi:hypothetical protein